MWLGDLKQVCSKPSKPSSELSTPRGDYSNFQVWTAWPSHPQLLQEILSPKEHALPGFESITNKQHALHPIHPAFAIDWESGTIWAFRISPSKCHSMLKSRLITSCSALCLSKMPGSSSTGTKTSLQVIFAKKTRIKIRSKLSSSTWSIPISIPEFQVDVRLQEKQMVSQCRRTQIPSKFGNSALLLLKTSIYMAWT